MVFVKSEHLISALAVSAAVPKTLDVVNTGRYTTATPFSQGFLLTSSPASIQGVAKTIAAGTMSYYSGSDTTAVDLPAPYYWWEFGALVGSMLDYSHYTGDTSYDARVTTALLAQVGPNYDFMLPKHYGDEGNDDQVFWGFAVMAAAESNVPQPPSSVPSWLDLGVNIWNSVSARWNTTSCGGGVFWQIFPTNFNGMHYKNSVSNGGLFQLSARLARATGDAKYVHMAAQVWDWSTGTGLVDPGFNVYDGADISDNCTDINKLSFTYSTGIYLYGAAVLANYTGDQAWADRAAGLLDAAKAFFVHPQGNATNILWEPACEGVGTCDTDMKSFKAYLSRFMYASTLMLPSLAPTVHTLLTASASAAADACSGTSNQCGQKWYVGGFDSNVGLGQQMSALETVHGLLIGQAAPPLKAGEIKDVRGSPTPASPTSSPTPTKRSNSASATGVDPRRLVLSALAVLLLRRLL